MKAGRAPPGPPRRAHLEHKHLFADERRDAESRFVHKSRLLTIASLSPSRVPGRASTIPRRHPAPQTPAARAPHPHHTHLCARLTGRLRADRSAPTSTGSGRCSTWSWTLLPAAGTISFSPAVAWCAGFCADRTHVRTRSRARLPSRPGERGRTGRGEHVLPMYAHVGVVSSVCVDGVMMYDVREGQGRRNSGLKTVIFVPEHARVHSRGHYAKLGARFCDTS